MSQLDPKDIERRAPVWEALSELFVGKELQDYDYRHIAKTLSNSGYALSEIEEILRNEVAPVFHRNLSPLGIPEMEGWSRDSVVTEVLQHINEPPGFATRILPKTWIQEQQMASVRERWRAVQQL